VTVRDSAPVKEKKKKKKKRKQRKKEERRIERRYPISLFMFFLLFFRASKILIFIKNNLKNTKNIISVRFNKV
jgi:hypothetical protein